MSKDRDKVDPEKLRKSLLTLAALIRELDAEDRLLEAAPRLLELMGDLRSNLFEYEVRCTGRLLPKSKEKPEVLEAQRIVDDAVRRLKQAKGDWGQSWAPGGEEDEEA